MRLFTCLLFLGCAWMASAQTYQEKVVAAVLAAEAASQGQVGMSAVAEVIHQRMRETGKTPYQVVMRKRAFSCLNKTTPDRLYRRQSRQPKFSVALAVALVLCREPHKLTTLTQGANHYTRKEEKPYWSRGYQPVAIVGAHAFYRLPVY